MPVYEDEERGTYYFITRVPKKGGGTRQVKRRGFETKREARIAEAKIISDAEDNLLEEENPTFKFVANEYLEWYEKRRKVSSYRRIKGIIEYHLIPEFGKKKLKNIRNRDITKFQNKLIDDLAVSTAKRIHATLSAVFNYAIKQEYTLNNPARTVGNIDMEENKRVEYWTLDEFKQFIKVVDDEILYAFFMTLYYGGMRKGEALALTWKDIDFENSEISIDKTVYNRIVTTPKTSSSIRRIIMPTHVMNLLAGLKLKNNPKIDYVVFGEFKDHIATSTLDRKYDEYVSKSKLTKIRIHDFRHSHASYLINKGTIPSLVAKRLGHGDVSTTLNTYSHLYPTTEKETVSQMEDDFKPAKILDFKAK